MGREFQLGSGKGIARWEEPKLDKCEEPGFKQGGLWKASDAVVPRRGIDEAAQCGDGCWDHICANGKAAPTAKTNERGLFLSGTGRACACAELSVMEHGT